MNTLRSKVRNVGLYAKAIIGFLMAGLTAAGTALTDSVITPAEWTVVAVAALGTLGAVYVTPNSATSDTD